MTSSSDEECSKYPEHLSHLKYFLKLLICWQYDFKISNTATTSLLHLLKHLIQYFGHVFKCEQLQQMSNAVPCTLKTVRSLLSLHEDDIIHYVVCPSCNSIYEYV